MPQHTANELIQQGLIRHQTGIVQVSGHLRNSINSLVDASLVDVRQLMTERLNKIDARGIDYGPKTTKRLQTFERTLIALLDPTYDKMATLVKKEVSEIAENEIVYLSNLLQSSLPVQVNFALPTEAQLRAIVFSRPMQGRLLKSWVSDWASADRRRIMEQMRIGLVLGETNPQIRRRVLGSAKLGGSDGVRNITKRGADFLTRTVTNAVANNARQLFYKENTDLIKKEVYSATLDSRTTLQCAGFDGSIYKVNKGPIPPIHGRCRSTRIPAIEGIDLGKRPAVRARRKELDGLSQKARRERIRELTGTVPSKISFEKFLRSQDRQFIDEYLGKTKGALFVEGKLPLARFTDKNLKPKPVYQLRIDEAEYFARLKI